MSRPLRGLLLGSIAIAFLYLFVHAREPLRLNVGDPWSDANVLTSINYVKSDGFLATSFTDVLDVGPLTTDSYRYIHYPPLAEIFYGAVGKFLGASDIGTFRLFALGFSGLAMWLLFCYVRRLYSDRIALIATALFSTSLMWMMYADSIHQAPVMTCMMFLALWGLVRALETRQRRHYAAAVLGSLGAFFTSYDCFIFLPAAVLFTVYVKAGNPFRRGNRHFVVLCAAGCTLGIAMKCLAVIGAVGWDEFVADLRLQFFERSTSQYDRQFQSSVVPTLVRRLTLVFTPLAWITAGFHALKAIRAPTVGYAIKNTAAWMLLAALAFVMVFPQLAASQMLAAQVFLPFYAIGSALVVNQLLEGATALRRMGFAWLLAAPLWSLFILFSHPRSFLARDDIAKTREYLDANDHNDYVLTNLMSAGHVQAAFQRHDLTVPADDPTDAPRYLLGLFESTGTDSIHEVIVSGPDSRFIDKSLWPLAMPRHLWAITGWPHLNRGKTNALIAEHDKRVRENLKAVGANKVLELSNFSVYRVDRADLIAMLGERVPITNHIDFGSLAAKRHVLLGWGEPRVRPDDNIPVMSIDGFGRCTDPRVQPHGNACKTVLTKYGLTTKHDVDRPRAELMLRIDQVCDQKLTFNFAADAFARFTVNGFTTTIAPARVVSVTIPAANVTHGINIVEIEPVVPVGRALELASLDIAPACPAP